MSKPAARLGDSDTGHPGAYPPTPIIMGSPNVLINNLPAARTGDSLIPHLQPYCPPHPRTLGAGASKVLINGKMAVRMGDSVSCGGVIIKGSTNVLIGTNDSLNSTSDASLPDIEINLSGQGARLTRKTDTLKAPAAGGETVLLADQRRAAIAPTSPQTTPHQANTEQPVADEQHTPPKDATLIIRLVKTAQQSEQEQSQFTLLSADGSISQTCSAANNQSQNEQYLELAFTGLDPEQSYTLTQQDGQTGETYTYFEQTDYSALGNSHPEPTSSS